VLLAERLAAKTIEGPDGCVLWTGGSSDQGYPVTFDHGRVYVHRLVWERAHGRRIPRGKVVVRTCGRLACVAVEHLRLASRRTMLLAAETIVAANARKTHCVHDHPLRGTNLIRPKSGGRRCRACENQRLRDLRARRKLAS
jgi:hypothetical protein